MYTYWGVDSYYRADTVPRRAHLPADVRSEYSGMNVFQIVTKWAGGPPEFWGRYIGASNALTAEERDFIRKESGGTCKIFPIFNKTGPSSVSNPNTASHLARQAVHAAATAGVPGARIYANIEGRYSVASGWILNWWLSMKRYFGRGQMGGIYCNPFAIRSAYREAHRRLNVGDRNAFTRYLFANYDTDGHREARRATNPKDVILGGFRPARVELFLETANPRNDVTVLWQYALNVFNVFDVVLATETGYADMWPVDKRT